MSDQPTPNNQLDMLRKAAFILVKAVQLSQTDSDAAAIAYLRQAMSQGEVKRLTKTLHDQDKTPESLIDMAEKSDWHASALAHALSIESHTENNLAYQTPGFGQAEEFVVKTHAGLDLRFDPAAMDYLRVTDRGIELMHWSYEEFIEDPQALAAALQMAAGRSSYPVAGDVAEAIDAVQNNRTPGPGSN